jgi:hypothetical protein
MNFPVFVYKDGGEYLRNGGTYSAMQVNDQHELDQHLASGFFIHPDFISANAVPQASKDEQEVEEIKGDDSELDDLKKQADELGIKYHHRAGVSKLKELILAAAPKE